jgi:hypothetical protein
LVEACAAADGSDAGDLLQAGCNFSFTASTRILLANGTTVPIDTLKPGDKVLATNTKTGKTTAQTVTAVLLEHDNDLYNLTINTAHGHTATIHTTARHPFWNPDTRQWIKADALRQGDQLRTPDGLTRHRQQRICSSQQHRMDVGPHHPKRPRLLHRHRHRHHRHPRPQLQRL